MYHLLYQRAKTEIFFMEGEEGSKVYFLISGLIKLYKTNEDWERSNNTFCKKWRNLR